MKTNKQNNTRYNTLRENLIDKLIPNIISEKYSEKVMEGLKYIEPFIVDYHTFFIPLKYTNDMSNITPDNHTKDNQLLVVFRNKYRGETTSIDIKIYDGYIIVVKVVVSTLFEDKLTEQNTLITINIDSLKDKKKALEFNMILNGIFDTTF